MTAQRALAAWIVVSALAVPQALAQSWTGGAGDNLWSSGTNWSGNVAPASGSSTVVTFGPGAANFTPNADLAWILNQMGLSGPPGYTLNGSQLTFDGAAPFITIVGPGHTINNPLVLNFNTLIVNDNETALTGGLSSPSAGLTKLGTGRLTLSGATMYNGVTTIADGTVRFGNGGTGPNTVFDIVNNGVAEFNVPGGIAINSNVNGSGSVLVSGGSASGVFGPMVYAGTTTVDAGATLNGSIVNNSRLTLDGTYNTDGGTVGSLAGGAAGQLFIIPIAVALTVGGDGTSTTYSGCISGAGNLEKVGAGRLTLAVSCMHNGQTLLNGGTLAFGDGVSGPGTVFDIVNNGALEFNVPGPAGIAINSNVPGSGRVTVVGGVARGVFGPMVYAGPTTINAGGMLEASIINLAPLTVDGIFRTTGNSTVGSLSGALGGLLELPIGGTTLTVGGDNSDTTFFGCVTGFGRLEKVGAGRLTLATACPPLNGTLVATGGILAFGNGPGGPAIVFDILDNAMVEFNATHITINSNMNGSGGVTVVSGWAEAVFGPMNYTGPTTVNAGARYDAQLNNVAPLIVNGVFNTPGSGVGSVAGSGTINILGGTLSFGLDNTSTTFSGSMAGPGGGTAKFGSGTFTFSGVGVYSGNTTVNAGTMIVTGSIAGPVIVGSGARLLGTGSVGDLTVLAGGSLEPGLSPGMLVVASLTLAGTLLEEIEGTTAGTQYDVVQAGGAVNLTGGTLTLAGAYTPVVGNTFTIINNGGVGAVIGTFAGLPEGGTVVFNGVTLRISYIGGDGNDVTLAVVLPAPPGANAVPVPTLSEWSLAVLALLVLLGGGIAARRPERR